MFTKLKEFKIKDFTYQVALLRAIESDLLNHGHVERMLLAKSAAEAFKVLNDTKWAAYLNEANNLEDYMNVLNAGLLGAKRLIVTMLEDERDFNFVWVLFDLHNAKILTKAKLKGNEPDSVRDLLSPLGTLSRDQMKRIVYDKQRIVQTDIEEIVEGKKRITLLQDLCDVIMQIEDDYKKNNDPEMVDLILNREVMEIAFQKVRRTKSHMIKSFFGRMIDIENIKMFLRRAKIDDEYEREKFEKGLIHYGKIETNFFKQAESVKDLLVHVKFLSVYECVRDHLNEENIDYVEIEKEFDEVLFRTLQESKYEVEGPEPIFAYFWTKQRNAEIIRAIMIGKLNDIEEKKIRKWLKIPSLPLA